MMREATLPQICCPAEKLPVETLNANRSDSQRVKHGIDDISRNLHTSNHNQVGCSSRLGHDLDTDKLVAVRRSHLQCCGSGLQACRQTSSQSHSNLGNTTDVPSLDRESHWLVSNGANLPSKGATMSHVFALLASPLQFFTKTELRTPVILMS